MFKVYLLLFLVNMKFPFDNQETRKWGCMYASLLRHQDYKCSLLFTSPNSYHVLSSRYFRQFLTQDFSSWICQTKYFARGLRTQALLWWRVASVFEPSHPPYSIYFCRAGSIFGRVGPRFELITYLIEILQHRQKKSKTKSLNLKIFDLKCYQWYFA